MSTLHRSRWAVALACTWALAGPTNAAAPWLWGGDPPSDATAAGVTDEDGAHDEHAPKIDERVKLVETSAPPYRDWKRPDAEDNATWLESQAETYAKEKLSTQRPLLELGRRMYDTTPDEGVREGINLLGSDNLLFPHLYVYGDWRTAVGYSDLGAEFTSRLATRLNLDIDLGLTATERIHALIRPLDNNVEFTQLGFAGLDDGKDQLELDADLETLFFEGDLGAMFGGPGAKSIPIAAGKVPLLFQNGVWVEDAFTGVAVSFPAKNSKRFDIANYDWTVFGAFDDVTTRADVNDPFGRERDDTNILGVAGFLEATDGYWEVGYAYADIEDGLSYHNVTASFTQRFGAILSNSVRVIGNFGQDPDPGFAKTADGVLLLVENSFITKSPYTVLPYLNLFSGFGTPQSLARATDAGGVLKNTGLNFETDALTAFPSLNATGHDAIGAALGIEFLTDFVKDQLVLEVAAQHPHGDDSTMLGDEYGIGVRYQRPIEVLGRKAAVLRFDAMYGSREDNDDISGIRFEFRWKF